MNTLAHAAPSLWRIQALEAWFEVLRVLRTPAFAIPSLAFPVVFYVLFAILLPGQWGGYQKSAYLLATYGAFGVIGPALFGFGVGLAIERENGWLELKRSELERVPAGRGGSDIVRRQYPLATRQRYRANPSRLGSNSGR